ncbi:MAG: hypothetical protein L6R36_001849 [Xanthoria steineri]|nr:MAG: hypothetical protein L6R36_001849 [Xanthoria steineri]
MDLSRQEYPALLHSLQPAQAVAILDERVKLIAKVNSDIAEWLSERRRVEEAYVQGLKRLSSKHTPIASAELGIFQTPWQNIIASADSLANSHAAFARNMETDIERPLRQYQRDNREMQAISTIQGNLGAIAKELDSAQKRLEKIKSGKGHAKNIGDATLSAESIDREWQNQAPYVFEQLQALDENRINHLRDVLTQLQTHEVDQVERNRVSAESCLNALLSLDTKDEISAFVARISAETPSIQPTPRSRMASGNTLATLAPSHTQDDRASEVSAASEGPFGSGSAGAGTGATPASPVPDRKPRGFGLRRLGTVMGRRKDDKKPSEQGPSPEKRSRPQFSLRRGTSSKNMQTIPSPDDEAVPPLPVSPPQRKTSSPQPNRPQTMAASPSQHEQRRMNEEVNGDAIMPAPSRSSSIPVQNGIQTSAAPTQGDPQVQPPQSAETQRETRRDTEGFNVAPPAVDEISRAQQEAAANEPDQPQFKLDIRSEPIHEEGLDTLSNMASTLRAQAQQIPTPRKPSANRGRRDVRNTVFVSSPQPSDFSSAGDSPFHPQGTFSTGKANSLSSEAQQGSDSHSVRSAHSATSVTQAAAKHPEMADAGLNASVVETVSAWFSAGQVTKSVVIGEVALAHNASESASSSRSENIRLENFPVLEKVAPNPTFVTQTPSRSGEYSVNLGQISRTAVAFKYQVHLEESNLAAHVPMIVTPSWKIEPGQASVIVNYSFNSAFVSPAARSVALKNVVVVVNLANNVAQACQSKPVGHFSKEKSLIYWRLGDIHLDGYAETPQKLLARFSTDGEGQPGSVEVRWEINGEAATGLGSGLGLSQSGSLKEEGGSDPFSDESSAAGSPTGAWKEVKVQRKMVSGKYVAN